MLMSVVQVHLSPPNSKASAVRQSPSEALSLELAGLSFFFFLVFQQPLDNTMKRCKSLSISAVASAFFLLAASSLLLSVPAGAQTSSDAKPNVRQFPKAAMRGEMVVKNHPLLTLNGKPEQLSPGARIFDKNNYLVLSGQLVNQELLVNYVRDGGGQIHQVWILNSEEAKEKRAGSNITIFNFFSGSTPATPDANKTAP
jgi:hypothetical protein